MKFESTVVRLLVWLRCCPLVAQRLWNGSSRTQGLYSLWRHRLTGIGIPIINWRPSQFIMSIPIPIRRRLLGVVNRDPGRQEPGHVALIGNHSVNCLFNGLFNKAIEKQIAQARKAMFWLLENAKILKLTIDVTCDLFDKVFLPVLLYGCEIWGWAYLKDIEIQSC